MLVMIAFELELNSAASLVPAKNHGQTQTLPRQKRWDIAPSFLLEVASYAVPEISDFVVCASLQMWKTGVIVEK